MERYLLAASIHESRRIVDARPRPHIREIGDPDPVRNRSGEAAIQQVTGTFPIRVRDGGAERLDAPDALEAEGPHRAVYRAAGHAVHPSGLKQQRHQTRPDCP